MKQSDDDAAGLARQAAWAAALDADRLPDFVTDRLTAAAQRRAPWLSTMTPAELLLGKSHGLRPVATVSGTCWFCYSTGDPNAYLADEWGRLTRGWQVAIDRLKREAVAAGANAIVDVKLRSVRPEFKGAARAALEGTADCTVVGTAVKFDRLPPSRDPVVATVSALDFVRLLEMGVTVCGIAMGTAHDFLLTPFGMTNTRPDGPARARAIRQQLRGSTDNCAVAELSSFWETIRRNAHAQLRDDARRSGNGVLAKVHLGELVHVAGSGNYIGRHMVIGTVVETGRRGHVLHGIETVVDLRDDLSPLNGAFEADEGAALTAGLIRTRKR